MIIPKHHFKDYTGAKSREAPANLKPVGTGPYKSSKWEPNRYVELVRNDDYAEEWFAARERTLFVQQRGA